MKAHLLTLPSLALESGHTLVDVPVHFRTGGPALGEAPLIWVFHALTANDNPEEWWPGLFGPTGKYAGCSWICVNALGSPYGSCSPLTHGGMDFPLVTVRDTVAAQLKVAEHLNVDRIDLCIGGSFGGYQALEFALAYRGEIGHLALIATAAEEKPWNKAIHEAQRLAMLADPTLGQPGGGEAGLRAARAVGMINYRTPVQYNRSQADDGGLSDFRAPSYIRYQAEKLVNRFDATCYFKLTEQLDTHDIRRDRAGTTGQVLSQIHCPTVVLAIDSDLLIPEAVVRELSFIPQASYEVLFSAYGHDGFLTETSQIAACLPRICVGEKACFAEVE